MKSPHRIEGCSVVRNMGRFVPSPDSVVKNEPMFFQATIPAARERGGPITRAFLDGLSDDGFLDSRVHMLMPGWWPCIPGWHHDDVERSRSDGQPNYQTPSYRPRFLMGIWGDAHCPTEFAEGSFDFPEPPIGTVIYGALDPLVEESLPVRRLVTPGVRYHFDDRSWHRGTQCTNGGWRWFGRITYGSPIEPANELRVNANVYMDRPKAGW